MQTVFRIERVASERCRRKSSSGINIHPTHWSMTKTNTRLKSPSATHRVQARNPPRQFGGALRRMTSELFRFRPNVLRSLRVPSKTKFVFCNDFLDDGSTISCYVGRSVQRSHANSAREASRGTDVNSFFMLLADLFKKKDPKQKGSMLDAAKIQRRVSATNPCHCWSRIELRCRTCGHQSQRPPMPLLLRRQRLLRRQCDPRPAVGTRFQIGSRHRPDGH
jgi:hypothetical protein